MQPNDLKLYEIYLTKIKESDEISFKLMGFVPVISGAGIFVLLKGEIVFSTEASGSLAIYWLLGIFGALITFFIYRWELRNIDTCKIFRSRVADMEERDGPYKILNDKNNTIKLFGRTFGKTEAEGSIYTISMIFWLAMPILKSILYLNN